MQKLDAINVFQEKKFVLLEILFWKLVTETINRNYREVEYKKIYSLSLFFRLNFNVYGKKNYRNVGGKC